MLVDGPASGVRSFLFEAGRLALVVGIVWGGSSAK